MAKRSSSSSSRRSSRHNANDEDEHVAAALPSSMRARNRAVAQREASRLARPERRRIGTLAHANRTKSAVTSTPSGYYAKQDSSNVAEEWCGPFSVARQMIAKREEARRKRHAEQEEEEEPHPLDVVMEQVELERKRKANPSLQWKSTIADSSNSANDNKSYYAKRQRRIHVQTQTSTPTLFRMCVNYLVANFEHVEALGDVDSSIRRVVCEELVAHRKLNAQAFEAVAEPGIEALELIDCAEVTQTQLAEALTKLLPTGLRFLSLHMTGRCFGPKAVQAIIASRRKDLFAISIGGAYLLSDEGAASLLHSTASTLSSLEFIACPLLGSQFCKALSTQYASGAKGSLLELSLEYLPLKKDDLLSLATASDALRNLKSLSVKQIEALDDEVVLALLDAVGDNLQGVDFSYNHKLSDDALSGIRRCSNSGSLRSLQLSECKNLTEAGLETLFTPNIPGLQSSPPMLRKLNLSGCNYNAVTDEVFCLAARASSMKREDGTVSDTLSSMGGLVHVDISGSSCTDRSMETLVATSASSIRELNVSFCPLITDKGLGYLVSKVGRQLSKIRIWGCAQITEEFLDGHARVGDSKFEVVGAWMKNSGGSVRQGESPLPVGEH